MFAAMMVVALVPFAYKADTAAAAQTEENRIADGIYIGKVHDRAGSAGCR